MHLYSLIDRFEGEVQKWVGSHQRYGTVEGLGENNSFVIELKWKCQLLQTIIESTKWNIFVINIDHNDEPWQSHWWHLQPHQ